jgi:hypothetical protein
MATKSKKTTTKSTRFVFSWTKLLVALSLALNLAFIVFLVTLLKTTYFDSAMIQTMYQRNLDDQGCVANDDTSIAYDRVCILSVGVDKDNKVLAPEWLKGQTFPDNQ